jgi:hypothetical protein
LGEGEKMKEIPRQEGKKNVVNLCFPPKSTCMPFKSDFRVTEISE